jgi:hypothetical protein
VRHVALCYARLVLGIGFTNHSQNVPVRPTNLVTPESQCCHIVVVERIESFVDRTGTFAKFVDFKGVSPVHETPIRSQT